jgi:arginase
MSPTVRSRHRLERCRRVVMQHVAIVGAASSIGLRPDHLTGLPQQVNRAPTALRASGLVERLSALDLGDVVPLQYRDFERPPGRPRNEREVADYSRSLGRHIASGLAERRFMVVLGGDCSIVLGCLLGARRVGPRIGLAYVDAHADFATPAESATGSVASMSLALSVGHGDSDLARLVDGPLVDAADVALIGRRDAGQSYGHAALARSGILDLPDPALEVRAIPTTADAVLERVASAEVDGFWILVDCDVLNPTVMPATGAHEPGGPTGEELAPFLERLAEHPRALGVGLTLYDPSLDANGSSAALLVDLVAAAVPSQPAEQRAEEESTW